MQDTDPEVELQNYEDYMKGYTARGMKRRYVPLNKKEYDFCRKYVITRNSRQSAVDAGFSIKTANVLMRSPKILAHIRFLEKTMGQHYALEQHQIITDLSSIAFTDFTDIADWDSETGTMTLKDINEISPLALKAIKSVKNIRHKDGTKTLEVDLHDKIPALNMLMKYLGMLHDENKNILAINNLNVTDVDKRISELLAKREPKAIEAMNTDYDYEVIDVDNDGNPVNEYEDLPDERIEDEDDE